MLAIKFGLQEYWTRKKVHLLTCLLSRAPMQVGANKLCSMKNSYSVMPSSSSHIEHAQIKAFHSTTCIPQCFRDGQYLCYPDRHTYPAQQSQSKDHLERKIPKKIKLAFTVLIWRTYWSMQWSIYNTYQCGICIYECLIWSKNSQ